MARGNEASIGLEVGQIRHTVPINREEVLKKGMDIIEEDLLEARTAGVAMDHKIGNLIEDGQVGKQFPVVADLVTIERARNLKVQSTDKASSFLQ